MKNAIIDTLYGFIICYVMFIPMIVAFVSGAWALLAVPGVILIECRLWRMYSIWCRKTERRYMK